MATILNQLMLQFEKWLALRTGSTCHRQLVILSGGQIWCNQTAKSVCLQYGSRHLWLGDSDFFTARGYPVKQSQKCLGTECDIAIYDGHSGLNASALLSLSGTVRSNGLLILCIPPLRKWSGHHANAEKRHVSHGWQVEKSQFINRWIRFIHSDENLVLIEENNLTDTLSPVALVEQAEKSQPCSNRFASHEQEELFHSIIACDATSHVITARRGRGKSALLGMLATHYANHDRKIVVCTALKTGSESLIQFYEGDTNLLHWFPPDSPKLKNDIDVLFIDEVASLPIAISLSIISKARTFILATTIEGYEGTGRGFINRLIPTLQRNYPALQQHSLQTPIRFYQHDTLEDHLTDVFMLQNQTEPEYNLIDINALDIVSVQQNMLGSFEILSSVIQLLTSAHYKTSPEDIMRIMDMPDTKLFVASIYNKPIAAAVVIEEGGFKLADVAEDIASGQRRVKGHLLAQTVSLLLSNPRASVKKFWRINRIAVSVNAQRQGLGTKLLSYIEKEAARYKVDFIGAAFGHSVFLSSFWQKNRYNTIRKGSEPEKSSGETSVTVLKTLSPDYRNIMLTLVKTWAFDEKTPPVKCIPNEVEQVYQSRILDYINRSRSHYHVGNAIAWWLYQRINLQDDQCEELVRLKWIAQRSDSELVQRFKLKGRKQLYTKLYTAFISLYWNNTGL